MAFQAASEHIRAAGAQLSNDDKLRAYGLYKQATEGPCKGSRPGYFDFAGRAKWDAWNALGKMSADQARDQYVDLVKHLFPTWTPPPPAASAAAATAASSTATDEDDEEEDDDEDDDEEDDDEEDDDAADGASSNYDSSDEESASSQPKVKAKPPPGQGPRVSLPAQVPAILDKDKNFVDWIKDGNTAQIQACLAAGASPDSTDESGTPLLLWACELGHLDIVTLLIEAGANIDVKDAEGATGLHCAAMCKRTAIVKRLLAAGADHRVVNDDGDTAASVAGDAATRALFESL